MQTENTIFISYRRTNMYVARAVYQHLAQHGYDVFLDYENIDSGAFEQIILNQIAARAHFLLILTPSALERCADPQDMVRREVEQALHTQRNVIPLFFEGFNFKDAAANLPQSLHALAAYNGVDVPDAYFEEAMSRLRERFLSKPLTLILHPVPEGDHAQVAQRLAAAQSAPQPSQEQLEAERFFEQGTLHLMSMEWAAAADAFSQAVAQNPNLAEAYYRRGRAYVNLGNLVGAGMDWEHAIQLAPQHPNIHLWRSTYHQGITRNFVLAMAEIEQAIYTNPQDPHAYMQRANLNMEMGNLPHAMQDYDTVIRLNPQHTTAYISRGMARGNMGDHNGAFADFDAAIQINPQVAVSYLSRGNARAARGELDAAIADYTTAQQLNPNLGGAYAYRGAAYMQRQQWQPALDDFDTAIGLLPPDPLLLNNRGWCYYNLGDPDRAILDYEAALRLNPTLQMAQNNLMAARMSKGIGNVKGFLGGLFG